MLSVSERKFIVILNLGLIHWALSSKDYCWSMPEVFLMGRSDLSWRCWGSPLGHRRTQTRSPWRSPSAPPPVPRRRTRSSRGGAPRWRAGRAHRWRGRTPIPWNRDWPAWSLVHCPVVEQVTHQLSNNTMHVNTIYLFYLKAPTSIFLPLKSDML